MTISLGNDIASFQGDVNFDTYKDNAQYVIVKVTEGNGFLDPKLGRNQSEARRVGLLIGYYHFARPDLGNSPESEAQFFIDKVGKLKEGEFLALDYECPNQAQAHVDWCRKWLDYVYNKTSVKPFIYLNQSQVQKFDWQSVVDGSYALWIAAYTYDPRNNNFVTGKFKSAAMQQWTNNQQVPGIPVKVDGDVFFGDIPTLKKYGYKPAPPPPPPIDWETKYHSLE